MNLVAGTSPRASQFRRLGHVMLTALVVVAIAACGGKSDAQKAADALAGGLAAHTAGNLDEASKQYKQCLTFDTLNKACLYDLGVIAQAQNRAPEAQNYYRLALASDPNYPPALFNLALLLSEQGAAQESIGLYRQYVKLKPEDAGGHLNLGLMLRANGDVAGGEAELAEAVKLNPSITVPSFAPPSPAPSPSV